MASEDVDETLESYGAGIGQETDPLERLREWILVEGDRRYATAGLSVAIFALLLVLHRVGVVAFVNDDSITRLASGMIAGAFSLVTLVVTINQLILSREFAVAGESRDRLGGMLEFQRDLEEMTGASATPPEPTQLFGLLVAAIRDRATAVSDAVVDHEDEEFRELVAAYTNGIEASADRMDATLESTTFGTFGTISAAIRYNEGWQIYVARKLRNEHADSLSEESREAFDELIGALRLFNVAREHFKTTYMQRELTRFSQLSIYFGVPAVLAAILLGLLYAEIGGPTIDGAYLPYVGSFLITIVLAPLALLAAYILRTATVARRTASVGPMLPQKDPGAGPFDVSYGESER